MISTGKPFSGFAVDDVDAARAFYQDVLGMDVREQDGMLALVLDGDSHVLVYPKEHHEPAAHTVLNFPVADVGAAARELAGAGIEMIRYDGAGQDEDGVMRGSGPDIAWFTDPAGNVLSILSTGDEAS